MSTIKPEHAALKAYYETLKKYAHIGVSHEGATETAFSQLLHATAKQHHWDLVPKKPMKVAGGRTVIPDGTLRDEFNLPRGYWEAKDTADDLKAEIKKKIDKKYPLKNAIFEDTQTAVLYQNNVRVEEYDLAKPQLLADLLNRFFAFAEPDIEGFAEAVEQFKERVPELANGLNDKIKKAHAENKKFDSGLALC